MLTFEQVELGDGSVDDGHSMPVHAETEGETTKGYSSRKGRYFFLGVVILVLIVATVGLVVGLPKSNSKSNAAASATSSQNDSSGIDIIDQEGSTETTLNNGDEQTVEEDSPVTTTSEGDSEETTTTTTEETGETAVPVNSVVSTERFSAVVDYLVSKGISERTELEQEGSYANRAASWVANDDPLALLIPGSLGANITEDTFDTRYILANIFYATGGEKWSKSLNFLSEKPSCEWYEVVNSLPVGVGCSPDGQIAALSLSKLLWFHVYICKLETYVEHCF